MQEKVLQASQQGIQELAETLAQPTTKAAFAHFPMSTAGFVHLFRNFDFNTISGVTADFVQPIFRLPAPRSCTSFVLSRETGQRSVYIPSIVLYLEASLRPATINGVTCIPCALCWNNRSRLHPFHQR